MRAHRELLRRKVERLHVGTVPALDLLRGGMRGTRDGFMQGIIFFQVELGWILPAVQSNISTCKPRPISQMFIRCLCSFVVRTALSLSLSLSLARSLPLSLSLSPSLSLICHIHAFVCEFTTPRSEVLNVYDVQSGCGERTFSCDRSAGSYSMSTPCASCRIAGQQASKCLSPEASHSSMSRRSERPSAVRATRTKSRIRTPYTHTQDASTGACGLGVDQWGGCNNDQLSPFGPLLLRGVVCFEVWGEVDSGEKVGHARFACRRNHLLEGHWAFGSA